MTPRADGVQRREITLDAKAYSVDAVQRAAYRLSDRLSCEVSAEADQVRCTLYVDADNFSVEEVVADFRNEVLDHTLRERIRNDTRDVRNLILALAYSRTGLVEDGND
jgi:His-Xaa-Ser system protein HxsD